MNIATKEQEVCYMEVEIFRFVLTDNRKLTFPPNQQKNIQAATASGAFRRIFDLNFEQDISYSDFLQIVDYSSTYRLSFE